MLNLSDVIDNQAYGTTEDNVRSPESVLNWILQFPDEVWSKNIDGILARWRHRDQDGLFSWIEQLPPVTQRAVASHYEPDLTPKTVKGEFARIMSLSNVELRNQLLDKVVHGAGPRNSVLLALETAALPAEQKARLIAFVKSDEFHDVYQPDDE